jgi:phosphoesterase RecJ-like protein
MLAMGMLLKQMGKRADLVTADRIPPIYRELPEADEVRTVMRVRGLYDAAILLECDGLERTRLRGLEDMFVINIDHHTSGREYGQLNWIDRSACSCGELIHRMVKMVGGTVTPEMATCLYTTLLTDTGGFCYGGIQASTFALAEELTVAGADPVKIARDIYFAVPLSKMKLMGIALSSLECERGLAWLTITAKDMERIGAAEEDCEGVVNYALSIAGVEAAVFLRELPEGRIRVSLRSKGKVSVAEIAGRMGGGGHENAAGCTLEGPLERATEEILVELRGDLG